MKRILITDVLMQKVLVTWFGCMIILPQVYFDLKDVLVY